MKRLSEQERDTGPNQDNKEKQSSVESRTKKTKQESVSESATDLLKTGLTSETPNPKNLSENEAPNGSETIQKRKPKSLMPVPKLPSKDKRAELALRKLKVKPDLLEKAPPITYMLKKDLKGGLKTALEAMRFATDDQEINSFLKVYDKIPIGDKPRVPWEAIAIAAKVNPKHLMGSIRLAVEVHCMNRSRFIAITNHPGITQARVDFGLLHVGAEKDRMALDIQNGVMRGPQGPTFVGKQVAVYNAGGASSKDDEGNIVEPVKSNDDGFDDLFPSPNDIQDKLVPIRQRLLEG